MRPILVTALGSGLLLAVGFGCSSIGDSCEDDGSCGLFDSGKAGRGGTSGATGGSGGSSAQDGGDSPSCDPSRAPSENSCVINEEYGVFVSPLGSDAAGDGSKAAPFATISQALSALGTKKNIFACADGGSYVEDVRIDATHDGIALYGGFHCATWSYDTALKAVIDKPSPKPFTASGLTAGLRVEDFDIRAADGTSPGESSIAVTIATSKNVVLRRTSATAGKGVRGSDAVVVPFSYAAQVTLNGNNANGTQGGAAKTCMCPAGDQSMGGLGGIALPGGQSGTMGTPDLGGGQAGTPGSCGTVGTGKDGNPAGPAIDGAGATSVGTIVAGTWQPMPGETGKNGGPGQGGGGGASSSAGAGGGGGCGGCGGAGGPGGGGGGGSIALLIVDSTAVTIDASKLTATDAGGGGKGAVGQIGQSDFGFGGIPSTGGCLGGNGAAGGDGGRGGGGAGGISVAVVYKGTAPMLTDTAFVTGSAGQAGSGANAGVNDGVSGFMREQLPVP